MSTNVIVTAISIAAFAGFMTGYTIAWRQRRNEPRITFDPVKKVLACDMPLTPDELDQLRNEVELWRVSPVKVDGDLYQLMNPTEVHQ